MVLLPGLVASGCSPAQWVNALVPSDGYTLSADQPYGPLVRQKLDIYSPSGAGDKRPIVVFFYGGNWQSGAKSDYRFVGAALASRGFVAVIPDYRLYPEARYPAFLEDGAGAVSWALQHAAELGGDPARVHLMGHSAGAYIAVMLALDPGWLGDDRRRLAGVVGLAGPYDFLPLTDPVLKLIFAGEADLAQTQPISFADGSAPPLLLISGLADTTVRPGNSMRLAKRIREHGGEVEEKYYAGVGHVPLIGAVARPLRFIAPVLDDSIAYLQQN